MEARHLRRLRRAMALVVARWPHRPMALPVLPHRQRPRAAPLVRSCRAQSRHQPSRNPAVSRLKAYALLLAIVLFWTLIAVLIVMRILASTGFRWGQC